MKRGSRIGSERDYFEIDRSVLIGRVNALKLTIQNTIAEIALLAAESVFDKPLSAKLIQKARVLDRMARRLEVLSNTLARARFPGPIGSRRH
jgi:hypothetical protein